MMTMEWNALGVEERNTWIIETYKKINQEEAK